MRWSFMSNKTEILSFDIFFDEYENKHNCSPEKYECFEAGQQSKQGEIDELQKRIESAMELLEYNEYVDSALQALKILKGEETK